MALFDPHPGSVLSVAPGKRMTSSMAPTLVLRDGRPAWALGLPGGVRIFTSVVQAIVNLGAVTGLNVESLKMIQVECVKGYTHERNLSGSQIGGYDFRKSYHGHAATVVPPSLTITPASAVTQPLV